MSNTERRDYICKKVTDACLSFDKHPKYRGRINWGKESVHRYRMQDELDNAMAGYIDGQVTDVEVKKAFVAYIESMCEG